MIFVTVGTEQYPFNRLMHWVELLRSHQIIKEEIVVQYGSSTYVPNGAQVYDRLGEDRFLDLIHQARVVVAHCGEGTVLLLDTLDKPYILVPRTSIHREHVDNHQVEMALALSSVAVPVAWSPGDLVRFLANPVKTSVTDISAENAKSICSSLSRRFSVGSQAIATL